MKTVRLIVLAVVLFAGRNTARAGDAVMLKSYSYQVVRAGYPMPKRFLRTGEIVKVLTTHGERADVVGPGGDTVSVRLIDLRRLSDTPSAPIILQPPVVAVPSPPDPSPSPNQTGAGAEKAAGNTAARRSSDTAAQPAPVRCRATTKKGEQCSRMTTSPNGLCWQHGGN